MKRRMRIQKRELYEFGYRSICRMKCLIITDDIRKYAKYKLQKTYLEGSAEMIFDIVSQWIRVKFKHIKLK